ncbi:hypothetical protein [Christensenella intestinihominis]|uniref:hypothetical protein n=1 Tax=Christensenella intestinihominis TaxID=1851429 RepID=UPI00082DFE1D|nr:hypothetical protein [Christensenella intestinihominis]
MKKKLVVVVLAVAMVFSCFSVAFAAENDMAFSQADLEKISEVQAYIDQINVKYDLDLYVYDSDIAASSVERVKQSINEMVQISEEAKAKEAEIDEKVAAGVAFAPDIMPRSNSWGKVADNNSGVYMTITYTTKSNPLRFASITSCKSSGRAGMIFEAPMGFSKTFSNGNKTAVVKQKGLLRSQPGLGCAPIYNPNFTAVATYTIK